MTSSRRDVRFPPAFTFAVFARTHRAATPQPTQRLNQSRESAR